MSYHTHEQERLLTELFELQAKLDAAQAARTAWMDEHMKDFAKVQVGEDLYDLMTGNRLGRVTRHYRYWAMRDPRYDTSMHIDYEFKDYAGHNGNTSSRGSASWYGTQEEAARILENRARMLSVEP